MSVVEKMRHIGAELKGHAPFTVMGALLGLGFMVLFRGVSKGTAGVMFDVFHPSHVVLSALVTASLFRLHAMDKGFLVVLVIGVVGSIGVATLSDSVIPFFGESILGVSVPTHAALHEHGEGEEGAGQVEDDGHHEHGGGLHLGFIEEWYIVFPAAFLGVIIGYVIPRTRFPHAGHVLISTWASSAHVLMNLEAEITVASAVGIFVVLFLAVWLPCCISDIVFPLLFVGSDVELKDVCVCHNHALHSHPHTHEHSEACEDGGAES